MSRRGVTLVELLVSATVGLIVIGGVTSASLGMQAVSVRQQQSMNAQQALRAAADLLSTELQKAGAGLGNARLGLGGSVTQSPIHVVSADAFATDTSFALPVAEYAAFASDSVLIHSGRTAGLVQLGCCAGLVGSCGGSCSYRTAGVSCMSVVPPATLTSNTRIVYANRTLGVACAHTVSAASTSPLLTTAPGLSTLGVAAVGTPCAESSALWCTAGTTAMPLESVGLRVNWKPVVNGGPQRPRLQLDPDGPFGPAAWQDVLWDVERLQVRLMIDDLSAPGAVTWFPDAAAGRPALDACTTSNPLCAVPGGVDARDAALGVGLLVNDALRAQLLRRLRGVEVTLTSRSLSFEPSKVVRVGSQFALDAEGLPRDGYTRRRLVFHATPRNFGLGEDAP